MNLSRRTAALGLGGTLVSGVAAGAWLGGGSGGSPGSRLPTRGRGARTAFGSVAVLGASRQLLPAGGAVHGHGDHHRGEQPDAGAGHGVWSQTILVGVEVHNGLDRPLLYSPGQFRLRVGHHGPSVTPYDAEGPPRGLSPGSTLTTWVSFLAPQDAEDLAVEFTEAGAEDALSVALAPHAATGTST
ncbi:MAG: hypothetical protein ACXWDM_05015 [Nocardioides sp.]